MAPKLFAIILIAIFIVMVSSKPVEESQSKSKEIQVPVEEEEMMETAAGYAPLPGFMIRRLKERRQQAQAQRRQGPTGAGRGYRRKPPCPQKRYYGVS